MNRADFPISSPAAIDVLREQTRSAHEQLERGLHVAQAGAGKTEFVSYLRALHAWQASFEEPLWKASWPVEMQAGERSHKCAWMEADLARCEVAALENGPHWQPPLASQAQRVGLAYVVEGAQLGTRVLSQRLSPHLDGWQPRWLQGYGSETGQRWKSFLAQLDILLPDDLSRYEAARAARQAFESLAQWFAQCGAGSTMPPMERPT